MLQAYQQILLALIPVYFFIGAGFLFRRLGWLSEAADAALVKLQIRFFYPALIFSFIFGNEALRNPDLLIFPPLVGFLSVVCGFFVAYAIGKLSGFKPGKGLRTFAFTTGIYNYGFIPIPLIQAIYDSKSVTGTLMVHNTGIEVAIWTIGILLLTGNLASGVWKKLLNPPLLAVVAGVLLNLLLPDLSSPAGLAGNSAATIIDAISWAGSCAIPLALILIGASIRDLLRDPELRIDWRVISLGSGIRLALLPMVFISAAMAIPMPFELRAVMVIQAAMPSGMFPIILSRHYEGSPGVAVQVVLATTLLSFLTIPFWVAVGQHLTS